MSLVIAILVLLVAVLAGVELQATTLPANAVFRARPSLRKRLRRWRYGLRVEFAAAPAQLRPVSR